MDYIEYLNIRLEQIKKSKKDIQSEKIESKMSDSEDISVFDADTKIDINNLDYEKLLSMDSDNNILSFALKDLVSFESIKKDIDKNHDDKITAEELKEYIENIAKKDGDKDTLSAKDFNILFKEKNINLEKQLQYIEENKPDNIENEKPLNEMSLSELNEEKINRETVLAEKQNAVNEILSETNPKVKKARGKANAYKKAMNLAIQEDSYIAPSDKNLFNIVLNNISAKEKELRKNNVQINNNKIAIKQIEVNIDGIKQNIATIDNSIITINQDIADLQKKLANPRKLTSKQKQHYSKKLEFKKLRLAECNKEHDIKESELAQLESEKTKLQEEQNRLESNKIFLEQQKDEFNKQKIELEEKMKSECSITTKIKINIYENALKKVDDLKLQEINTIESEQNEALNAINEVTIQTTEFLNNKFRTLASNLNIEDIPIDVRNRCSGGKIQTLNDGTEVLTLGYTHLDQMQPELVSKISAFQRIADEEGLIFVISDGSRTVMESNSSRARKGDMVAPGGASPHNYGAAIDIALYRNGKNISAEEVAAFAQRVKAETGIKWGGDFETKGNIETHHYELANWRLKYKNSNNLICQHIQ